MTYDNSWKVRPAAGPWRLQSDAEGTQRVVGSEGTVVAEVVDQASGRLLAAAPDLLIAAHAAVQVLEREALQGRTVCLQLLRAAMARVGSRAPVEYVG